MNEKIKNQDQTPKESIWKQIDMHILIPGAIFLLLVVIIGAVIPEQFNTALLGSLDWIMAHFKWVYVLCVIMICALFLFILCGKWGNIRFGGKHAKPSIGTGTWLALSITGTIAVSICFFGVSGPVNLFMNPPSYLNVEGGTAEAVIPAMEISYLHYCMPCFFVICCVALMIGLNYYNGRQSLKASATLNPLIGDKCHGIIGIIVDVFVIIGMIDCGTNMGLAVLQLNSGIGTVAGMDSAPSFEPFIVIFYTVMTILFACSGVHKLMGKLSNINAICYFSIIVFVVLFSPVGANRLLTLEFQSLGEFVMDFIPMISFGDVVGQTGWQNNNTMFYYSWALVPGLLQALFYVSIAYGRSLREFIVVNCLVPALVTATWYCLFGGTSIFLILEHGSDLFEQMQQYGDGAATFAFLELLPGGTFLKWFFIILAIITFITFADSIAYSIPMLILKKTELDPSKTNVPKMMNAVVGLFMGFLTFVLLYVGGYDALNSAIVVCGFPAAIITIFIIISGIKFLCNRDKYDYTFQEEQEEERLEREKELQAVVAQKIRKLQSSDAK